MKTDKLFFILSIFGVLLIIFIGAYRSVVYEGEISKINSFNGGMTLNVTDVFESVVIFSDELIDLKVGDKIRFTGRKNWNQGSEQIIVLKIWKGP
ncbi:MAG: hypothetical protein IH845_03315 [Nanoarchaeota archaeon]|nr:hypothetical protein [Nanoarchaeota archaeon]